MKPFEFPLTRPEIEKTHQASLQVLSEVGVKISHPEIRKLLLDAGARPGHESVLFLPAELVENSVKKAPPLRPLCRFSRKYLRGKMWGGSAFLGRECHVLLSAGAEKRVNAGSVH